jgi:hypothetical protein
MALKIHPACPEIQLHSSCPNPEFRPTLNELYSFHSLKAGTVPIRIILYFLRPEAPSKSPFRFRYGYPCFFKDYA